MEWISSKEVASLLNWKTSFLAITWAKQNGINYFRKGSGFLGRYWFRKEEVLAKLKAGQQYLTARQAATILGKHRSTLKRWQKQGLIKSIGRGKKNTPLFKKSNILHLRPKNRSWTLRLEIILKHYYQKRLFSSLFAEKLKKSTTAVKSKAYRLGLTKMQGKEDYDYYYLKEAAEFLGASRHQVGKWIKSSKLEAQPIISIGGRIKYEISEEQIARFMAFYPEKWKKLKPHVNLLKFPIYAKLKPKKG